MSVNTSKIRRWGLIIVLSAIIFSLLSYAYYEKYYQTGYIVKLGTYNLGLTLDKESISEEYQLIIAGIQEDQEHLDFVGQPKPQYIEVEQWFPKEERTTILNQMRTLLHDKIVAWEIRVDGRLFGIVDHKETGEQILSKVKARYSGAAEERLSFKEQVTLDEITTRPVQLDQPDDIVKKLVVLQAPAKTHTVLEGDTIWDIAIRYNLTMDELLIKNPNMGDRIKPGQIVMLSPEVYPLNVLSDVTIEEQVDVPYEVERVASSSGIKPREGIQGLKSVSYLVEKVNGTEIERSIIQEEIIKAPVNRIEVKKARVQVASVTMSVKNTGFIWPTDGGIITSQYGQRNGRLHKGIDISGTSSLDIRAVAAGEVTFSGSKGDYGNLIIITHENGLTTYYAHMKKNLVSAGDQVKAGQSIAVMGRTGNATGVSVHFEVREKGRALNPLGYISQ